MATSDNPPFKTAEAEVQAHSASLRRELGIADLVLAQILIIIVPEFYGTAVKAGNAHVVLWLLAILLFFIPHALVVAHLNRLMPLEGGLYEWARLGFSDRVGFLTAWNIWLLQTVQVSQIALVTTTYISYAAPRAAWIATSQLALVAASVVLIALMMLIARLGLGIGKWFSNAGSVVTGPPFFPRQNRAFDLSMFLKADQHAPVRISDFFRISAFGLRILSVSIFSGLYGLQNA